MSAHGTSKDVHAAAVVAAGINGEIGLVNDNVKLQSKTDIDASRRDDAESCRRPRRNFYQWPPLLKSPSSSSGSISVDSIWNIPN